MEGSEIPNLTVKRSLILSGGGMRVAFQAGAILALEEAGIVFSHWDGTSGGIFNVAMLASGQSPKEIAQRWRTLPLKYFLSGKKAQSYLRPFKMAGFTDADNIRNKVFPHLGINLPNLSSQNAATATFNVCNFSDKTIEAISNKDVKEDHLIAGVSLPLFMPALKIGKDWYTDAVWIKDAHLMEGIRQGSEELWVIWAIGNSPGYRQGALNQYVHMIEMSANGGLWEEFAQIHWINQQIKEGISLFGQKNPVKIHMLYSPIPIPLDPDLFFNRVNTRELINMGYAMAKKYMQEWPLEGDEVSIHSTKCQEAVHQISFRGVFKGNLEWEGSKSLFFFHAFIRFSEFGEYNQLDIFSSIHLKFADLEIPMFDHRIFNSGKKEGNFTEIHCRFILHQQEYLVHLSFFWVQPWEILLGLGFKQISIRIINGNREEVLKGTLFQSLGDRLKSVYFRTWVNNSGKRIHLRRKISILKKLIAYGI